MVPSARARVHLGVALLTYVLAAACGSGGAKGPKPVSIAVTPAAPALAKGTTLQLTATGTYADGTVRDVTADASWSSSAAAVAVADQAGQKGLARGMAAGAATVAASVGGVRGEVTVTVTPAEVVALQVTPAAPALPKGLTRQLVATAVFTDDTTQDLTADVAWDSSDPAKASVSNAAGTKGLATALQPGATTIRAQHAASGTSGQVTLTVSAATVTSFVVSPATASLPAGLATRLTATATFSDGAVQDVTEAATWSSSDATKAAVSDAAGTKGRVTCAAAGAATITAAHAATGSSATAQLTVTSATLTSLAVSPGTGSVPKGLPFRFAAVGTFSDGSTQDVSESAAWSSSAPATAAVSNVDGSRGLVSTLATGAASVTATLQGLGSSGALTVSPAAVVSIAVSPAGGSVVAGLSRQLSATGTFTDGSTQDVTQLVTWSPVSGGTAVVSNAAGSKGVATGLAPGTVQVGAVVPGGPSASTSLTVTAAQLVSIAVTPPPGAASLPRGFSAAFTAVGTYSDLSARDVTALATWSTSAPANATVSNAAGQEGVVTAAAGGLGAVGVVAQIGAVGGSATIQITAAQLLLVQVPVSFGFEVPVGIPSRFTAIGTFDDGSSLDLGAFATFSASAPEVTFAGPFATATGVPAGGTVTVTATAAGVAGQSVPVDVSAATLAAIFVTPPTTDLAVGGVREMQAEGLFSDASAADVTAAAQWTTSDPSVATVALSGGVARVTAVGPGSASITAAASGRSGSATVHVVVPAQLGLFAVAPNDLVGGNAASVQIALTQPLSGADPTEVTLASDHPAIAVSACAVLPGHDDAVCPIATGGVAVETAVTLTATYRGASRTATVTLRPASLVAVVAAEPLVDGGTLTTVRVVLDGVAAADRVVSLASSSAAVAPVPATLTVPAGESQAEALYATGAVGADTEVTITASLGGVSVQDGFTVRPGPGPGAVVALELPDLVAGGSGIGTVTIEVDPLNATTVTVTSAEPAVASVGTAGAATTTVVIPAGAATGTFSVFAGAGPVEGGFELADVTAENPPGRSVTGTVLVTN